MRPRLEQGASGRPLNFTVRQQMRRHALPALLGALSASVAQTALAADGLCEPLRKFVESVKPNDTRVLKLRTNWGSNFKDSDEPAISAKRCEHNGYEPAKAVCAYLIEHSATEFSGNNAKSAIVCLSPKTQFAARTELKAISLSMTYGTENRGELVDLDYSADDALGGMVLSITVRGY